MTTQSQSISVSEPRTQIRVTFESGEVLEGPINATIEDFITYATEKNLIAAENNTFIAAVCNGKLRELTYPLTKDSTIRPIMLSQSDGGRIYRRSLVLLLTTAVEELWPGTHVNVNYAVPDGGFFCEIVNREPFTEEELQKLEAYMHEIVKEDNPITKRIVSLDEAIDLFEKRGDDDKVRLLNYRTRPDLTLYQLRNRSDYYYGYMVPSTRYLSLFRLVAADKGFILQYPRKGDPTTLKNIRQYDKLVQVFRQTDEWLERMQVEDIGRLNQLIGTPRLFEMVLVAEALHEQNIASIAGDISAKHNERGTRLVLIAGPSSSGKTTFSKRLAIQLLAHGLRPFTLEMDNYFVNRELTPRDENGDYDFESLEAVNVPLFNEHLQAMMEGKQVRLPRFNFHTGSSEPGQLAQLQNKQVIIIEGIHGLNPALVAQINPNLIFRIYVSALTQLNTDSHNRIPTTDVRLLRRIVRDARTRGYNAAATLQRWHSVRRGEKRNIFPYQENADRMFNSALVYELAAMRPLVEPLLLQVEPDTPEHIEANRLLSFVRWVQPLNQYEQELIPDTSLLREFIGGSSLTDYHPAAPIVDE